jgi:hypothetical protein
MGRDAGAADVSTDLATAVGLCAIGGLTTAEAAAEAGVTRWELEETIESAGLAEPLDVDEDADVASDIDSLLDGEH